MKISELINRLEKIKEQEGDLPVYYFDTGYGENQSVEEIEIEDRSLEEWSDKAWPRLVSLS